MTHRKSFVNFTPIHPTDRLMMETAKDNFSTRVIDLVKRFLELNLNIFDFLFPGQLLHG